MQNGVDLFKTSSFVYMSLPQRVLLKINIACPVCLHHGRGIGHGLELSSRGGSFSRGHYLFTQQIFTKQDGRRKGIPGRENSLNKAKERGKQG